MSYSIEQGRELITYARKNIESYLSTQKQLDPSLELKEKYAQLSGAFITLSKYHDPYESLRGCIGIILPTYPLWETIQNMSIAAAVEDPRFPPVKIKEMDSIVVEISILSIPEKISITKWQDYFNEIKVGRDGLIASRGGRRGLLLPQVPIEHNRHWDVKTFLEQTCQKALLPSDAWKDIKQTTIERFTATIFEETKPRGEIRQKQIGE